MARFGPSISRMMNLAWLGDVLKCPYARISAAGKPNGSRQNLAKVNEAANVGEKTLFRRRRLA
jgi:hypothetical protein